MMKTSVESIMEVIIMKKIFLGIAVVIAFAGICFGQTHIPAGDVFGIWDSTGSPYYIDGEIHVPTDSMLRIEPGCSIIFTGRYKFCVDSNAVFKAIGTEMDSIVFTAQDTVLTDSSGGYSGIKFNFSQGCSLSYCVMEYGNSRYPVWGGVVSLVYSELTIQNCLIWKNISMLMNGGGLSSFHSNVTIQNSLFQQNTTTGSPGWADFEIYGGAIYSISSVLQITSTTFFSNLAGGRYSGVEEVSTPPVETKGGAIYANTSDISIKGCIFRSNNAKAPNGFTPPDWWRTYGGPGGWGYGGACCFENTNVKIINSIFNLNWTNSGLGGSSWDGLEPGEPGQTYGGAIYADNCDIKIVNSTVSDNYLMGHNKKGGELSTSNGNIILLNSIIETKPPDTIWCVAGSLFAFNCCIDSNIVSSSFRMFMGNISDLPMFVDTVSYYLSTGSPCIDAGAESVYISIWDTTIYAPTTDLDGNPRPLGDGWDIGAYEYDPDHPVMAYELFSGWNLLSVPFSDTFALADLFPFYIYPAWAWDNESKTYNIIYSVTSGKSVIVEQFTAVDGAPIKFQPR